MAATAAIFFPADVTESGHRWSVGGSLCLLVVNCPVIPAIHPLHKNKEETYKNKTETTEEAVMLGFIKDLAAFITLGAFTIGSLTWMDVVTRLV